MPPYTCREIICKEDLDALVPIIHKAQNDPYLPSVNIFFPINPLSPYDPTPAIQAASERLWKSHRGNPASHWIVVDDEESGEIVGGGQWEIFETNPFANGIPKIDVHWWPAGEGRQYCSEILRQVYGPRCLLMRRAHTGKCFQ